LLALIQQATLSRLAFIALQNIRIIEKKLGHKSRLSLDNPWKIFPIKI
jgi:hypothetical protein